MEEVGEVEGDNLKSVRGHERSFEGGGDLVGIDLNEADEGVDTSGKRIVPDDVVREKLQYGRFEGGDVFFTEGCGRVVSEGGKM